MMRFSIPVLLLFTVGCIEMPAKSSYVQKLAKNHQKATEGHQALLLKLNRDGVVTGTESMKLLMEGARTASRAAEIAQEPAAMGLPPGAAQIGKGLIGMMMGNPMALTGLATGLMTILGVGGAALKQRKTITAMNEEGRKLRDSTPEEAKEHWEKSSLFKSG